MAQKDNGYIMTRSLAANPIVENFIAFARDLDISMDVLLEGTQLDTINPSSAASLTDLETIIANAYRASDCPHLAILFGKRLNIYSHGTAAIASLTCESLDQSIDILIQYLSQNSPLFTLKRSDTRQHIFLEVHFKEDISPLVKKFTIETGIASTATIVKSLFRGQSVVECFKLDYQPDYPSEWITRETGIEVRTKQPTNGILYYKTESTKENPYKDSITHQKMLALLKQENHDQRKALSYAQRIEKYISSFPENLPTLETIATELCASTRTVSRKLKQENTSYKAILEKAKRQKAERLLIDLRVSQVSEILGYSSPANFSAAFKLWTNKTPTQFKKDQLKNR